MVMIRGMIGCAVLLLALVAAAAPVPVRAENLSAADRTAIETVVHDYLLAHPEVIAEAITVLRAREQEAESTNRRQALVTHREQLLRSPQSPVAGNPQGDVTMVEFFDYACGYCKAVQPQVEALIAGDAKLRVVYKEFPILGEGSRLAARAALAARAQGKYVEFHNALMNARGGISEDSLLRVARSVGLDGERLQRDMKAPAVEDEIAANLKLAEALAINGTPGFVIGDQLVPGAVDLETLRKLVAAARHG
jgi:protein-disulfide isomerase